MANRMMFAGYRAAMVASAALLLSPALAAAAPADMALMKTSERVPDLQAELPSQALAKSAVVGQLTPGVMAASSIAVTLADGGTLIAKRQRDVSGPMGSKSWVGEFGDAVGSSFVLTQHKGVISGFFTHGDAIYEIVPNRGGAGSHLLYRIDESRLPGVSEPAVVEGGTTTSGGEVTTSANGVVVDLMVVYTPASRARHGQAELEAKILSAVASSNQAMANSAIDASFNLVYMGEVSYTETGDMTQALTALQGTSDGKMDQVHALRDQYGADLVQLVDEDSNWCGYANIMRNVSSSFAAYAFSVVRSDCLSNLTVQHELGHNFGNHHDRESTTSTGAYEYSFGYRRCTDDGTGTRTIMSYPCSSYVPRVNNFSDPYKTYNGYPLGIAYETSPSQSAENVRSMRNTMSTIASLRGGGTSVATAPPAPGSASALAASDTQVDLTWADNSSNESGFRVERSPNGVDWSEVASVGANVRNYASTGLAPGTWYYYRVRAWNSVGNSDYSNVASARTEAVAPPPPAAPSTVSASAVGSEVTVGWTDLSSNEAGFHVLREKFNSRKGTWGSAITMTVGANLTSLLDSPGSGTFRYSVRSYNAGGMSAWAGPASATVAGTTKGGGNGRGGSKGGNGKGGGTK